MRSKDQRLMPQKDLTISFSLGTDYVNLEVGNVKDTSKLTLYYYLNILGSSSSEIRETESTGSCARFPCS